MKRLERQGYGSSFNELFFNEETIRKVAKNEYGKKKIEKEKIFFTYVLSSGLSFPVPAQYVEETDGYSMRYYKEWVPLFRRVASDSRCLSPFLSKVYLSLDTLHTSNKIQMEKETVKRDLQYEMITKIKDRYAEVQPVLVPYLYLQTVNGIHLESYETLFSLFQETIDSYLESKEIFTYSPLHGDCQFNNILVSPDNSKLLFIDPRGYFGSSDLYGLEEYDTAKVWFALTGYDLFDSSIITKLEIEGSNLILPEIALDLSVLSSNTFTAILTVSIWLGNPHSFKDQPLKAVYSYYYGLYLASLVYRDTKSLTK
jgi:hypothetical protein